MSKQSRIFLTIIITGLAFIAGVRLYRVYEKRAQEDSAHIPQATTFHNVPVQQMTTQPDSLFLEPLPQPQQEIFLEDELTPKQSIQQAQETISSVLRDYQEMQEATGVKDLSLEHLSGNNLGQIMQQYPQLQQVIAKHAQNPEFSKTLQEIFQNPQFIHSVGVLQKHAPVVQKEQNIKR